MMITDRLTVLFLRSGRKLLHGSLVILFVFGLLSHSKGQSPLTVANANSVCVAGLCLTAPGETVSLENVSEKDPLAEPFNWYGAGSQNFSDFKIIPDTTLSNYAYSNGRSPQGDMDYRDNLTRLLQLYQRKLAFHPPLNANSQFNLYSTSPLVTSITLTPTADAYVNRSSPSSNYGASTVLRTDNSPVIESYLLF